MSKSPNGICLPPGSMIQEYKIEKILGTGNFGIVYQASNIYLDEVVAIKEFLPTDLATRSNGLNVLPLSPDFEESYSWALDRFLKEAKILWQLGKPNPHPNIVEVKRFHKDHGTAYMVMAYEKGESLLNYFKNHGPLSSEQLESILRQLLDGLEKVHATTVLHRDIKPSNILIRPDGSPVLIDFGAARRDFLNPDKSILAVYSPMYAALEQVAQMGEQKQGPWTDIYGLGATFYHLVTGKPPTDPLSRINGAVHPPAINWANKGYKLSLLTAIDAAIESESKKRPQSIAELRKLLNSEELSNSNDKTIVITRRPVKKNKSSKRSLILAATFVVIGIMFVFWPKSWTPHPLNTNKSPEKKPPVSDKISQTPLDRTALLTKIQGITQKVNCSSFTINLSDNFNLQIAGHLGSKLELETLRNKLKSLEGINQLETNIVIYERPFCLAVNLLKRHGQENTTSKDGVEISLNKIEKNYHVGDFLVINARASKLYEGYLYIDFLDSTDHIVTHLFPSPVKPTNFLKANEMVKIGINQEIGLFENKRSYKLLHSGIQMVVAIYSKNILFEQNRPEEESIEDYLSDLQTELEKKANSNSLIFKITPLTVN